MIVVLALTAAASLGVFALRIKGDPISATITTVIIMAVIGAGCYALLVIGMAK